MQDTAALSDPRFTLFIQGMTALLETQPDEPELLVQGRALMAPLLASADWLPAGMTRPRPDRYAQYLLYCDPQSRFSVVSFVWGPGQKTPVHNHTVWGLVGMLQGCERCEEYQLQGATAVPQGHAHLLRPGQIEAVSPTVGDWHRVSNALDEQVSISIHVYGADIGAVRRQMLNAQDQVVEFVSGYTAP